MKSKKLIILAVLIICMIGITSGLIIAWLTDTKTTPSTEFTVGKVSYEWAGELTENQPVVPGQQLIKTTYKLTNSSTVESELRVKIIITYKQDDEHPAVDGTHLFATKPIALAAGWTLDADGYYYYGTKALPTSVPAGGGEVDVLNSLILDGSQVGKNFSEINFSFSLIFEAKQKEYVTWEQLGTANIDFGTGLTKK